MGSPISETPPIDMRFGVRTAPAVASVIGIRKFFYDAWGNTVNTAARLESHGEADRIQISAEARVALGNSYTCQQSGEVVIKGKGLIET